jgi:murein DD-endopeptidase MepM/ murein hydrolase activator NlpD
MQERDTARAEAEALRLAAAGEAPGAGSTEIAAGDLAATLEVVTSALGMAASERDAMAREAAQAAEEAERIAYDMRLLEERHDGIFERLEEAVTVSMEPLDRMFTEAGMDPTDLLDEIRSGYSGLGGPLMPLTPSVSTSGRAEADPDMDRANSILEGLDRMNMYRIAAEKAPFAMPLKTSFRFTSPYGRRWGRMHEGVDLAGGYGSPVLVTADGVVTHAGWESGYGKLVTVRHAFGLETRYGHLSEIRVNVGDRVSRGDRIGDMGNTGRSTGTHLHYEVRVGGNAVNPMTFIKAGTNVF